MENSKYDGQQDTVREDSVPAKSMTAGNSVTGEYSGRDMMLCVWKIISPEFCLASS